jgi:hypothetical protein
MFMIKRGGQLIFIYIFFELLHKQFPNINGMCSPAQIHLYTDSLQDSIFIFNANNNRWLTISNLDCIIFGKFMIH